MNNLFVWKVIFAFIMRYSGLWVSSWRHPFTADFLLFSNWFSTHSCPWVCNFTVSHSFGGTGFSLEILLPGVSRARMHVCKLLFSPESMIHVRASLLELWPWSIPIQWMNLHHFLGVSQMHPWVIICGKPGVSMSCIKCSLFDSQFSKSKIENARR